jgi:2-oxoglutarate dehydrogenase E2 component (dihydrolipoamide succinyltransferase)
MHNIIERPIAVNGKVEIHPMMYGLSYDHRIIDGRESVGFWLLLKKLETMELLLTTIPKKHLSYKNYFKISKSPV